MSTIPEELTAARLRDNVIRDALGLPFPAEDAVAAFEVLLDLIEEASSADGIETSTDTAADLPGCVATLDRLLVTARNEAQEAEKAKETAEEEHEEALEKKDKEHEDDTERLQKEHEEELAGLRDSYEKANADLRAQLEASREARADLEARLTALKKSEPYKVLGELLSAATNYDAAVIGITDHPAAPKVQRDFRKVRDRALEVLQSVPVKPAPVPAPEPAEEEIPLRSQRKRKKN